MINCQNIFSAPLDPVFLGASLRDDPDIFLKTYDSSQLNFMPKNAQFIAETENGTLETVHIDTVTDFNKAYTKTEPTFNPRYLYMVDFVVKLEFLCSAELKKNFNYMQK